MPFQDPRSKLPHDGQECQFKVTGDPKITGVIEPTFGTFKLNEDPKLIGLIGTFKHRDNNTGWHVWKQNEYEVAAWRPIEEYEDSIPTTS